MPKSKSGHALSCPLSSYCSLVSALSTLLPFFPFLSFPHSFPPKPLMEFRSVSSELLITLSRNLRAESGIYIFPMTIPPASASFPFKISAFNFLYNRPASSLAPKSSPKSWNSLGGLNQHVIYLSDPDLRCYIA